jgi:hypothetical protein
MIFGRKRRPSQQDEGHMSTDMAELGAEAEDDDIIELVDVIEIPEDRRGRAALHGHAEDAFGDEFAEEASAFDMTPHEVADLLEDESAEILEDEDLQEAERLFSEPGGEASGLAREEAWDAVATDAFRDEEVALSKDFDMDKILREDDSDKLIADFMASHRPEDVEEIEEGGVLVEEYVVEDQDMPLFRQDEQSLQGSSQEGLTDFGVPESEPSGLGTEEEMARLFEAALAEQMAGGSGAENAADDLSDVALEKMIAEELAAENEAETVADDLSDLELEKMIAEELAAEADAETTSAVLTEVPPDVIGTAGVDLDHPTEEEALTAMQPEEPEPASVAVEEQVQFEPRVVVGTAGVDLDHPTEEEAPIAMQPEEPGPASVATEEPVQFEPRVVVGTAGVDLDHLTEEEALTAMQPEEPETASVAAEEQVPFEPPVERGEGVTAAPAAEIVPSFADEAPFILVEQVEPPTDQVPASGISDVLDPGAEPLFSISAICTMAGDAMSIEEEILFAHRPAEEAPEVCGRPDFAGAVAEALEAEDLQSPAKESQPSEELEAESTFSLDTFFPVADGEPSRCTRSMELLDLVTHMETRLMGTLQDTVEPHLTEMMRGEVRDELEGLRRLIDHIDKVEDLRL